MLLILTGLLIKRKLAAHLMQPHGICRDQVCATFATSETTLDSVISESNPETNLGPFSSDS